MLFCSVEGCGKPYRAKGYCKEHYQRMLSYGRVEKIKSGVKTKHRFYIIWNSNRHKKILCNEWLNFYKFVNDIGEKPKDTYLARLRLDELFGPNNFHWKSKFPALENESQPDRLKRLKIDKVSKNPNYYREANYKYNFKITIDHYNQKLKNQNGVCEICKNKETAINNRNGLVKFLSVDHNHTTGQIRDLLCTKCNFFIGRIENNPDLLQDMINYLKKHST